MMRNFLSKMLVAVSIGQMLVALRAAAESPSAATGEILVRVVDAARAVQAEATVDLFSYDSKSRDFKKMPREAKTDSTGIARHDRLSAEEAYYVVRARNRDGLVGYHDCTLKATKARQNVDVTVLQPVAGTIHLRDESGKPITGASIWSIMHSGVNGSMPFDPHGLIGAGGLANKPSDKSGELALPELPGGKIDIKIVHPDYAPIELTGLVIDKSAHVAATMSRGIKLRLQIKNVPNGAPIKGLMVNFQHVPYEDPSTLSGPLPDPEPDGTVQLTVAAGK
jgi:hypothetical protein